MSSPHSALILSMGLAKKPGGLPPSTRPAPSPSSSAITAAPKPDATQQGAKASREEACFVEDEQICGGCKNYTRDTGDCSKVEGLMDAGDGCSKYFEAARAGGGMDDLMGSTPPSTDPLAAMGAQ